MEFDEMRGAELFFCRSFVFPSVSRHFFCMFASTAAFNKLVVGEGMGGGGVFDVFHHEAAHRCTEAR